METITLYNYFKLFPKFKHIIEGNESFKALHQNYSVATKKGVNFSMVESNATLKEMSEKFIKEVNQAISKDKTQNPGPKAPTKRNPQSSRSTKRKSSAAKPTKPKPIPKRYVPKLTVVQKHLIKALSLIGKSPSAKSLSSYLDSIQKDIEEGVIETEKLTKEEKDLLKFIENRLVKLDNDVLSKGCSDDKYEFGFDLDNKATKAKHDALVKMVGGLTIKPSAKLLSEFVAMQGNTGKLTEGAKKLADRIKKAIDTGVISAKDTLKNKLNEAHNALRTFVATPPTLNGVSTFPTVNGAAEALYGCCCELLQAPTKTSPQRRKKKAQKPPQKTNASLNGGRSYLVPPPMVQGVSTPIKYSLDETPNELMKTFNFTGDWEGLFGNPTIGFKTMIFGGPKQGKSTLTLQFADYLAKNFGPVLYAGIEEAGAGPFENRVERLYKEGLISKHPDVEVVNYVDEREFPAFDFVVIDSVNRAGLDIDDLRKLIGNWPQTSFIFVFQVTKGGLPRGSNEFRHEVDVEVEIEKGKAIADGRFGPGEMEIVFSTDPFKAKYEDQF